MHSFGSPICPASRYFETNCWSFFHSSSALSSSSTASASVDFKLPFKIPQTGLGPSRCSRSNDKIVEGKDALSSQSLWNQRRWKLVSATQNEEHDSGTESFVESQDGKGRNDMPEVLDTSSSVTDLNVLNPGLLELQKVFAAPVEHIKESWNQVSQLSRLQGETTRRRVLGTPMFMSIACVFGCISKDGGAYAVVPAVIDSSKVPTHPFDATDERLRDAAFTFEQALNASTVTEEERLWTVVIEKYEMLKAEWVPDIISRAYGNRGNARSRQGKLEQALEDYDKSITLAPYAVDPVLNRGVVLEGLGCYDEASADYEAVLDAQPNDPAAWNNLGNVKAAQNKWEEALLHYGKAVQLAPVFSFAAANYALALYQIGRVNEAMKQFRALLRKYPEFPDMRAALAVSLYAEGLTAEAESNWGRLEDGRYKDRGWVRNTRRWPPRLANALEAFLDVRSSTLI